MYYVLFLSTYWVCMARFWNQVVLKERLLWEAACLIELMPAKAKPTSSSGSASLMTYIRGKTAAQQQPGERIEKMWQNNSEDTKVSEEREEGGDPGTGAEIPPQSTVKQAALLQPMEVNGGVGLLAGL